MSVNIDKIRTDGGTQSRAAINEATVAEYADAMADPNTLFPPVIVYFDGREYWLADGFHRLAAWAQIGRAEIPAEIRQGDRRAAILHSVAANSTHGLRRTNEDKRRAVLTLLEDAEWSAWSDGEIARRCGVSREYVNRMRSSVTCDPITSENRTYTTRHGTTATMNTGNIGAGSKPDQEQSTTLAEPQPLVQAEKSAASDIAPPPPAPLQPVHDQDPGTAKARRELAKLTPEALIEDVIGLRADLADERAKRRAAEAKVADLKEQIAVFEADHDMGAKLGAALNEIRKVNGRLKETQTQLARETRRANVMESEVKKLRAELENQVITL